MFFYTTTTVYSFQPICYCFLNYLSLTSIKITYYAGTSDFFFFINWLHFLTFLFCLGFFGALFNNKTFITVLLNLELMLFSIGMTYVLFSVFLLEFHLQVYSIIFLVLAAAESCLGLAVAVVLLRTQGTILLEDIGSSRT